MAENPKQIKKLREAYEKAVNDYVAAFLKQFDVDDYYTYWVGGRVGLDVLTFLDLHAVNLDEIIYIVENNVTYDEFCEWESYNIFAMEFNQNKINLQSWHMGYHGLTKEQQQRLIDLKADLNAAMEEYKNNPNKNPY